MIIQSVLIPKKLFTLQQANLWIRKHHFKLKFKNKNVHNTANFYRYRQNKNDPKSKHISYTLPDGVILVLKSHKVK